MNPEDINDILLEAIEVLINHILYARNIYPEQIFEIRRIYNAPVYVSIYPAVNSYIRNVLQAAKKLMENENLHCLEVVMYCNENDLMESYVLELIPVDALKTNSDPYLLHYEEQLRAALYKMSERVKHLPKLPNDTMFKIQLHTTESAFVDLTQDSQYQDFPWLKESAVNPKANEKPPINLLPLATVHNVGLKLQAHVFTK